MSDARSVKVVRGTCHALFAYDVAWSVELDEVHRRMAALSERSIFKRKPRTPQYLEFRPPPLRIVQEGPAVAVAGFATRASVDLLLYDFGALSVSYRVPLEGASLPRLLDLSDALYENSELLAESRARVDKLVELLNVGLERPGVSPAVEDYVIYEIESWDPPGAETPFRGREQELAQILRCERERLSDQEVTDALSHSISFKPDDLALVDWNAAILFGSDMEDMRSVLEFANVELLESRVMDAHLDEALDRAYESLTPSHWSAASTARHLQAGVGGHRPDPGGRRAAVRAGEQHPQTPRRPVPGPGLSSGRPTFPPRLLGGRHSPQARGPGGHLQQDVRPCGQPAHGAARVDHHRAHRGLHRHPVLRGRGLLKPPGRIDTACHVASSRKEHGAQRGHGRTTWGGPTQPLRLVAAGSNERVALRKVRGQLAFKAEVRDGEVTLSGTVHSWAGIQAVIGAAKGTPGVRTVQDQLRIEPYV